LAQYAIAAPGIDVPLAAQLNESQGVGDLTTPSSSALLSFSV